MTVPKNVRDLPISERGLMALRAAIKQLIEEHARAGLPIYIWHDGEVVEIPPHKLREQAALLGADSR